MISAVAGASDAVDGDEHDGGVQNAARGARTEDTVGNEGHAGNHPDDADDGGEIATLGDDREKGDGGAKGDVGHIVSRAMAAVSAVPESDVLHMMMIEPAEMGDHSANMRLY